MTPEELQKLWDEITDGRRFTDNELAFGRAVFAFAKHEPIVDDIPLPDPEHYYFDGGESVPTGGYTENQMREYAKLAAKAISTTDECKGCALIRQHAKTAWDRGHIIGKASNDMAKKKAIADLDAERRAHADTNVALTAEITRLEAHLQACREKLAP